MNTQSAEKKTPDLGSVWIRCSLPVVTLGLTQIFEGAAQVHIGRKQPEKIPQFVLMCMDTIPEDFPELVERIHELDPATSVIVFGLRMDLSLAQAALQSGAQGFVHAGMQPKQILRAVVAVSRGELVAPRQLLEFLIAGDQPADLDVLSARQREILEMLASGLSNAQIGKQLYLSESTIKQHLRSAYKLLGVKNRTEAAKVFRGAT